MHLRNLRALLLVVALLFVIPLAQAAATPSNGVNSQTLHQSSQDGRDFIIRESTFDPGASTGWHWHDGKLIGAIKQGTLTHYRSDCSVDGVYNAGDTVTEPTGPDHVHIGRNLGPTPLVLEVIYINPAGKPLAEDAPNPGCPFD
jgi:quercetin dioxygenase-like cupin family protein